MTGPRSGHQNGHPLQPHRHCGRVPVGLGWARARPARAVLSRGLVGVAAAWVPSPPGTTQIIFHSGHLLCCLGPASPWPLLVVGEGGDSTGASRAIPAGVGRGSGVFPSEQGCWEHSLLCSLCTQHAFIDHLLCVRPSSRTRDSAVSKEQRPMLFIRLCPVVRTCTKEAREYPANKYCAGCRGLTRWSV